MNIVEIAGHLGADPETRFTNDGTKVITMRVATKSRRKGQDSTIWWRVTIWGDRFDKMMPYLKKGSAVIVVGEMREPEIYAAKDGQQRVSLEITAEMIRFSPFGKGGREEEQKSFGEKTFSEEGSSFGTAEMSDAEEETVPF